MKCREMNPGKNQIIDYCEQKMNALNEVPGNESRQSTRIEGRVRAVPTPQ